MNHKSRYIKLTIEMHKSIRYTDINNFVILKRCYSKIELKNLK